MKPYGMPRSYTERIRKNADGAVGRWDRRDKPASLKRVYREPKRQERRRAREEISESLEELEIEREETAKAEARVLDFDPDDSHPDLTDPPGCLLGAGNWGPLYMPVEDCDGYEDDSHPDLTDPPDDYELTGYGWDF